MPCYRPIQAFKYTMPDGKCEIVFSNGLGKVYLANHVITVPDALSLPCGRCIGCRLEKSRQWAMRCMHEASLHEDNMFLTLTYDEKHLPPDLSLDKSVFQRFIKRLRKHFDGIKIRYFHCGEYGDRYKRPHYHALIFGLDFPDKVKYKTLPSGEILYTFPKLEELWGCGFATIGSVTFESAAYVARYVTKKVTGEAAEEHYTRIDEDGFFWKIQPEYATMSRRPGIGRDWFNLYKADRMAHDYVVVRGVRCKPPRYYDNLILSESESRFEEIKQSRVDRALKHASEGRRSRLLVKEAVQEARLKRLVRPLD